MAAAPSVLKGLNGQPRLSGGWRLDARRAPGVVLLRHTTAPSIAAAPAHSLAPDGRSSGGRRRSPRAVCSAAPEATAAVAARPAPAQDRDDFVLDKRPVILYDGVCGLCNRGVNFMLDNDPGGAFRLAALQSPAGRRLLSRCGRRPDDLSSIVLVTPTAHHIRSEAILRIGVALRVPLPLLAAFGFPVPLPLRDAFYDAVANNRYSFFGRTDSCRLRDAGKFADRFIVD
ncbi:hypothetical protein GPECTOR_14g179 [Gonium pectorale]|uniref:Thiol-disulfide oxidoreductase DCC n=1 Tax=Gonium pectorale TaxID=33097 RepID=A0A150GM63_GONPE|nr:hypothetical protein GPECTOR_14g179 [Gonium pectorale]|eukprot:KXZ50933.1 hypothetical protein GPECTOR_14g179 [Gonium pectorale]